MIEPGRPEGITLGGEVEGYHVLYLPRGYAGTDPIPVITTIDPISGEFAVEEIRYTGCRDGAEIVLYFADAEVPGGWYHAVTPWARRFDPPFHDPPSLILDFFEALTMP